MSWYKIVEQLPSRVQQLKSHDNLRTKVIEPLGKPEDFTLVSQFFIACTKLDGQSHIILPIVDADEVLQQINTQIIPYFERSIGFFQNDQLISLSISGLKSQSRQKFISLHSKGMIHPLITDLYRDSNPSVTHNFDDGIPVIYQLDCNSLVGSVDSQFEPLANLIRNTYLASENSFAVIPTGWSFSEHLLQSMFLKALSMICNQIFLYVNPKDASILYIIGANN